MTTSRPLRCGDARDERDHGRDRAHLRQGRSAVSRATEAAGGDDLRRAAAAGRADRPAGSRRRQRCSSGCRTRTRASSTSCASPRRSSPRCARSPASPTSPTWSSTTRPAQWLVESKSLKLYLGSFRNHGAFHEDCTLAIGGPAGRLPARRAGCASAATGIRAAACRSTCSGRPAGRRRGCGCPTRACRPIAAAGEGRTGRGIVLPLQWWLASDPSRRPAVNPARPGREQR